MPELPEVETIVKGLKRIQEYKVMGIWCDTPKMLSNRKKRISKSAFLKEIKNKKIKRVFRRAKYIVIEIGRAEILLIHLKMTGQLLWRSPKDEMDKYVHVILKLNKGKELRFSDLRKFGIMRVIPSSDIEKVLGDLGVEPLGRGFTVKKLAELLEGKSRNIKAVLMDQKVIAGIGNIYADEILFEAKIHPKSVAGKVPIRELHRTVKKVLRKAVRHRGSSNENYVDVDGRDGSFQRVQKVYRRKGERCVKCNGKIERIVVNQRGTHFCKKCQKIY